MPKCFKCEKEIVAAMVTDKEKDIWQMPKDAVLLEGGATYGSAIYDSMMDGTGVMVIICDDCLRNAKDTARLREFKVKQRWSD